MFCLKVAERFLFHFPADPLFQWCRDEHSQQPGPRVLKDPIGAPAYEDAVLRPCDAADLMALQGKQHLRGRQPTIDVIVPLIDALVKVGVRGPLIRPCQQPGRHLSIPAGQL